MFSILIPLYNGVEFLEESVQSVINQTNDQWELLIGVNGHPPNSEVFQKANQYASNKIRVYDLSSDEIKGKCAALNTLVKYTINPFIAILDVDDIWHPTKLDVQVEFIEKGYDVVGSRCIYFGERLNGIVPQIPVGDITTYDFIRGGNPVINSSVVIRREYAYWTYEGLEDYELWLRLWRQNLRFYNCSQILVKHRLHSESAFNSKGNGDLVPELLRKYSN
jgi:glycosyltransferase involved in cell wall biosynthesis